LSIHKGRKCTILVPMPEILTIRTEQIRVFSDLAERSFEDWLLNHVKKYFSAQFDAVGEADIREIIRSGRERASQHGFRAGRDVCKYIDLMIVLGRDFDTEPRTRWAAEILARSGDRDATMRALFAAASRHLRKQ
jgi:hypothetical protein